MDTADIYSKLTTVFRDALDDDSLELTPELSANDIEEWDSLTHVRLILSVEKAFSVRFSTAELSQFENVGQLADMVSEKTAS